MKRIMFLGCWLGLVPSLVLAKGGSVHEEEFRAWKALLAQTQGDHSAPETVTLLQEFLRSFPASAHSVDARFALAEAYFHDGRYGESEPYYEALADKGQSYAVDAMLRLGESYYNMGRYDDAQKAWQKLESRTPKGSLLLAEAWYGLVLCQMRQRDYFSANKTIEKLTRAFPSYAVLAKVMEINGILRFQEKNFGKTLEALEGLHTPNALLYRGFAHFYQKHYLEAANAFKELEGVEGAFGEIGGYFGAECFRMADNASLAEQAYDDFSRRFPISRLRPYALVQRAALLHSSGRNREALETLAGVPMSAQSPDFQAQALGVEAQIMASDGNHRAAVALIDKALSLLRDDVAKDGNLALSLHAAKAGSLIELGRSNEALSDLGGVLDKLPYHPLGIVVEVLRGQQAFHGKDWNSAILSFQRALLQYPYGPLTEPTLGLMFDSYWQAGRAQELVTQSNRLMQVVDAHFSAQQPFWRNYDHFLLGEAYYRLKIYGEAQRHYEAAAKSPELASRAKLYAAWADYRDSRYHEALQLARQVLEGRGSPTDLRANALFLTAGISFSQGDYQAAVERFHAFRDQFPGHPYEPDSWLHEGWAQSQLGDSAKAVAAWRRLVLLFPASPLAQEASLAEAQLYFQQRHYLAAAAAYARFLKRWPSVPGSVEAQWGLAQSYYNAERFEEAIREYQLFAARFSSDARASQAASQIPLAYYRWAVSSGDAQLLANFIARYPASAQAPDAQYRLGRLSFEQKNWKEAVAGFQSLLLHYPGASQAPSALFAVAQAQEKLQDPDQAARQYESLLELFPGDPLAIDAAMRLGANYFNRKLFAQAVKAFQFVAEHDAAPEVKADAVYNQAVSLKKSGDSAAALQAFDSFAQAYPADKRRYDAALQEAAIEVESGQPDKAVDIYVALLRDGHGSDQQVMAIRGQIGDLYKSMGNKAKAIESYKDLLGLKPAGADPRLLGLAQLAALYEEQESWDEALDVYGEIARSHGRKSWVDAAAKRRREISAYLRAVKPTQEAANMPQTKG